MSGTSFHLANSGARIRVYLSGISKDTYSFYESIIKQFENDGGAFQAAPASTPSNISGGAIGLFNVSAVQARDVVIGED